MWQQHSQHVIHIECAYYSHAWKRFRSLSKCMHSQDKWAQSDTTFITALSFRLVYVSRHTNLHLYFAYFVRRRKDTGHSPPVCYLSLIIPNQSVSTRASLQFYFLLWLNNCIIFCRFLSQLPVPMRAYTVYIFFVWAPDTRQGLWKQELKQGPITNWKQPSLPPKWHLGGRLLRWRRGGPSCLKVTAPMTHDCLWHLGPCCPLVDHF